MDAKSALQSADPTGKGFIGVTWPSLMTCHMPTTDFKVNRQLPTALSEHLEAVQCGRDYGKETPKKKKTPVISF